MDEIRALLAKPEFPRASHYHPDWMVSHQMGPNAVWLVEWLCEAMTLEPGMRVLDLGCGKAMTSVFLARELGVRVWAADLWVDPDDNWRRIAAAGAGELVCPLRVEAHALPFAAGFFDAAVSIDAYQYFGTDDLYLDYLGRFVRPGGTIGVVVPGLTQPLGETVPEHLARPQANGKRFWEPGCRTFKTAGFWRELWRGCPAVADVEVDTQPEGWRHWRDFERAVELSGKGLFPSDAEALEADAGRFIGFHRVLARRTDHDDLNLYDPSVGVRVGLESRG